MNTRSLILIFGCLVGGAVVVGQPTELAAQCTMKCKCDADGCGCQRKGGNGDSCHASGDGCYVGACEALAQSFQFAPDGTVAGQKANGAFKLYRKPASDLPVSWVRLPSGISVAQTCGGAVAGRFVPTHVAAELRGRSRMLSSVASRATQ